MNSSLNDQELQKLLQEKKAVCDRINDYLVTKYKKYEGMSEEVINDNPYRYLSESYILFINSLFQSFDGS